MRCDEYLKWHTHTHTHTHTHIHTFGFRRFPVGRQRFGLLSTSRCAYDKCFGCTWLFATHGFPETDIEKRGKNESERESEWAYKRTRERASKRASQRELPLQHTWVCAKNSTFLDMQCRWSLVGRPRPTFHCHLGAAAAVRPVDTLSSVPDRFWYKMFACF
jgi:hypothetical protein